MTYGKAVFWCSIAAALLSGTCFGQAPASTSSTSSSASSSSSAAPASPAASSSSAPSAASSSTQPAASSASSDTSSSGPSPDLIKKARAEGFKPETHKNGETVYCYKDANLGTRFETKKCVSADGLQAAIDARQDQRNNLHMRSGTCAGAACGAQ
jgi:hypothetical protein